jgi:hypothetical protein
MAKGTKAICEVTSQVKKTMTTAQVAMQLHTSAKVVLENAKKCLPDKKIENGKATHWTEAEITILLDCMKHNSSNHASDLYFESKGSLSTDLTPALKIKKAMELMQEGYEEELQILKAKNLEQAQRVQELEHQVEYNEVIDCKRWTDVKKEYRLTRLTKAKVKNSLAEREYWFEKCMGMDKFPTLLIKPEAIDLLVELNKKQ